MIVAEVIPITSSILTESLSYFSASKIESGTIVTIPLRKKNIKGIVISTSNVENIKQNLRQQNFKIRNILDIHNSSIFSGAYLKTVSQIKNYYLLNTGKVINITYPKYILDNINKFSSKTNPPENNIFNKVLLQKRYSQRISYYKELLHNNLSENKSTHIICPTKEHCGKIFTELNGSFEKYLIQLHSGVSKTKLDKIYKNINNVNIIISTPNFIDVHSNNKTTIILEKDSSSYYYKTVSPYIDMRIFIEQYAKNSNINLIIADSILRPKRYEKFISKDIPKEIFSKNKITTINAHKEKKQKQTDRQRIEALKEKKDFSPILEKMSIHIKNSVENNEKIFCYVQKKGHAPIIICKDCGKVAVSKDSMTPYSLYIRTNKGKKEHIFLNKITGKSIPAFDVCQFCSGWKLKPMGIGTNIVADELEKIYPKAKIFILDSSNIKTKKQLKTLLDSFNKKSKETKILVGTQKALPYLNNIDSSFLISIDSIFAQMSYTSDMRALYIINEIYEATIKHLFIQSRNILENSLPILKNNNFKNFIKLSLDDSKQYKIDPFGTLIKINHICKKADYEQIYNLYKDRLSRYIPDIKANTHPKLGFIELNILLHVDRDSWNIDTQDQTLSRLLPFSERDINIEINPEVF